jgi:hypothetical protein
MMTYILMIWTVVAMNNGYVKSDWRPLGEFHYEDGRIGENKKTPLQMCEAAAKELAIKSTAYRCVRSK